MENYVTIWNLNLEGKITDSKPLHSASWELARSHKLNKNTPARGLSDVTHANSISVQWSPTE